MKNHSTAILPVARLLLAVIFSAISSGAGSNLLSTPYFVSPSGNDQNDGSLARPFATINHALEGAVPGDTIFLRGGSYSQQVVTLRSGTADAPITLMNYRGETPYLDGSTIDASNGVLIAHDHITLIGLKVRNWASTGIWLQSNSGYTTVRACEVYDCVAGIDIYEGVHDFVIDSVDLHDFAEESHGFDATSHNGMPIYNGLVSNSRSHDGKGGNCDGFALGHVGQDDPHFYASFGDIRSVRFVNCQAYNVGDGFDISGKGIVLERCLAHDTFYGGNYKLWASDPTMINCIGYNSGANVELDVQNSPPVQAALYNCTFYNGTSNNIWIQTDSCRLRMYNCIVAGGDNVGMRTEEVFRRGVYEGDYNLFHCGNADRMFADPDIDLSLKDFQEGTWQQLSGQDAHSKVVFDPTTIFIDTNQATINLHLRSGSPTVNAGTIIAGSTPTIDFDGAQRNDGAIDIGAYELGASGSVYDPGYRSGYSRLRIYANPIGDQGSIRFSLAQRQQVRLALYDALGQLIATIFDREAGPDELTIAFDAAGLAPGAYFVRLQGSAGDAIVTRFVVPE